MDADENKIDQINFVEIFLGEMNRRTPKPIFSENQKRIHLANGSLHSFLVVQGGEIVCHSLHLGVNRFNSERDQPDACSNRARFSWNQYSSNLLDLLVVAAG